MNRRAIILAVVGGLLLMTVTRKVWALPAKGAQYIPWFQQAEYMYGLPAQMLARVAKQESNFDPGAFNTSSGASGMMQIIPRWHPGVNVTDLDPQDDIFYAAKYLRENFNKFGSWAKALAAYNWGPGNLGKVAARSDWLTKTPLETQRYVTGVLGDLNIGIV